MQDPIAKQYRQPRWERGEEKAAAETEKKHMHVLKRRVPGQSNVAGSLTASQVVARIHFVPIWVTWDPYLEPAGEPPELLWIRWYTPMGSIRFSRKYLCT